MLRYFVMDWMYKGEPFVEELIDDNYGFVYMITNLVDGRKYIGKKFFYTMKTKQVKKKKKRYKDFSDWKVYYGSNHELQDDVVTMGEDKFHREIIHLCKTKGECAYMEAKEQFLQDAILTDGYYNSMIMCRINKTHVKGLWKNGQSGKVGTKKTARSKKMQGME